MRFPAFAVQLSEAKDGKPAEVSKRVQVMRTGSFKHPSYGKFSITKEHLDGMVKNFSENVRGIELAVDYKHDTEGEAAAWFKGVEVATVEKGHALFAEVDWTPRGEEKIRNKEFKYLSGDFNLTYTDAETSKNHGPTLLGAGLTNRPFIKNMDAVVQLSENPNETGEEDTMKTDLEKAQEENKKLSEGVTAAEKKLSEVQAENDKLKADAKKHEDEKKLSEKKGKFDKMLSEKKVVEAQRVAFMADDFEGFTAAAQPAPKDKKLAEGENKDGEGDDDTNGEEDAQDKIFKLAEALSEKDKISFSDATKRVLKDPANKKLAEEYNNLV